MSRAIDQNVSGHQVRVGIKTDRGVLFILARLFLELRHAVEPAHARNAVKNPTQLGMSTNARLVEQDRLVRIEARRDKRCGDLMDCTAKFGGPKRLGNRVHIHDAIEAFKAVIVLQGNKVPNRPKIIP